MTVYPEEYMDLLVEYCMLKINAVIKVLETNQSWSGEDDFSMEKPKLSIQVIFYYDRRFIIHLKYVQRYQVELFLIMVNYVSL